MKMSKYGKGVAGALAMTALTAVRAEAGVEYVTAIGNCTKVATGQELSIMAGPNIAFRVFGNSVDLTNPTSGFRVVAGAGVTATMVRRGTDCGSLNNTGFAVVVVNSPGNLTSNTTATLFFKMPLGDESSLKITIKPHPNFTVTWAPQSQQNIPCIRKTGSVELFNQDQRLRITLPAGHRQDQTTCNQRRLIVNVSNSPIVADIKTPLTHTFRYSVTGAPPFVTSIPGPALGAIPKSHSFDINVAGIRGLTQPSVSTITIANPVSGLSRTLNLEVVPSLSNGFTQAANCRSLTTGDTVNVDDPFDCELRLALRPPPGGQLITFEVQDRLCVAATGSGTYSSATGIGSFTTQAVAGTPFNLPLRALGGNTSVGSPCSSESGVQHTVKFWLGPRGAESGPTFTRDTFRIRSRPQ